jgi:phosphoribosylcarboxyaminoimidazole (NCAIR) mutase
MPSTVIVSVERYFLSQVSRFAKRLRIAYQVRPRAADKTVIASTTSWEQFVKQLAICMVLVAMAGCAQLPSNTASQTEKPPVSTDVINFTIPADALGARDAQLSAVLAKAGALAAAQKQPTTILVTALGQDLPYLNQAIWRGVPSQHPAKLSLENLTAGANQPYSVSIRPTSATP